VLVITIQIKALVYKQLWRQF